MSVVANPTTDVCRQVNAGDKAPATNRNMVNLGCGHRFKAGWTNVDIAPAAPGIIAHDLRRPLPFADRSFDLVYHSHVLEHFRRQNSVAFLAECLRVLRPGGVLRVVVPDLEVIVRCYLDALQRCRSGEYGAEHDYDWMMLELYDQTVREQSGGGMAEFLSSAELRNEAFVEKRLGVEARQIIDFARTPATPSRQTEKRAARHWLKSIAKPSAWRRVAVRLLLGHDEEALRLGRFRFAGEVHQWMYDSYSLGRLLRQVGFEGVTRRSAVESYIEHWSDQQLDTGADGTVMKPDSLIMEGRRPIR